MTAGASDAAWRPNGGGLSLDELTALNDEIVGLIRAGLPLEPGLTGARRDLRGRLGRIVESLADRLRRGESLEQALEAEKSMIPPIYRAVVETGMHSGRPAIALEGLADSVRRYQEVRRILGLALVYPVIVLFLAYGLFVAFVVVIAPRFVTAYESLRVPGRGPVATLARLGEWAPYWGPILPLLLVVALISWARSGCTGAFSGGAGGFVLNRIPWLGSMLAQARAANFAELLALLIEGGVALPEAVVLAADSSGDRTLRRGAPVLADAIRQGRPMADALRGHGGTGFPPLLRWLIGVGERRSALAPALRHAAEMYRRRAVHQAQAIRTFLPTMLILLIGTAAVAIYALAIFVPFTSLLNGLTSVTTI